MPSPSAFDSGQTVSASNPREIRAALTGEETAHFDLEYRQVMADAAESLDLSGVVSMLKRWQRVAWSSVESEHHALEQVAALPAEALSLSAEVMTVLENRRGAARPTTVSGPMGTCARMSSARTTEAS